MLAKLTIAHAYSLYLGVSVWPLRLYLNVGPDDSCSQDCLS